MVLWINGAFGAGKTTAAFELKRRVENSFVYDPENFGYFIRKNAPPSFSDGDFQDIPLWRETTFKMLELLSNRYDGLIIVPMTLVNVEYYNEIIIKLINSGITVRHFILYASKDTLFKRLRKRSLGRTDTFAIKSIDRCIHSFDNAINEVKILADNKNVDDIVMEIAEKSGISLKPDKRTKLRKLIDRYITLIKHIR